MRYWLLEKLTLQMYADLLEQVKYIPLNMHLVLSFGFVLLHLKYLFMQIDTILKIYYPELTHQQHCNTVTELTIRLWTKRIWSGDLVQSNISQHSSPYYFSAGQRCLPVWMSIDFQHMYHWKSAKQWPRQNVIQKLESRIQNQHDKFFITIVLLYVSYYEVLSSL